MRADAATCGIDTHTRVVEIGADRGEATFRSRQRRRPKLIVDEDYELLPEEHGPPVDFDAATFNSENVWVATRVQRDFTAYHGVTADEAIANVRLLLQLAAEKGRHFVSSRGAHIMWWRGYTAVVSPDLSTVVRYRTNHYERTPQMIVDGVKSRLGVRRAASCQTVPDGIEVGFSFEGTVANIVNFGAFVDIGGFEALLHKSAMGADVEDPADVVSVGDTLRVQVISVDRERHRVNLQLVEDGAPLS